MLNLDYTYRGCTTVDLREPSSASLASRPIVLAAMGLPESIIFEVSLVTDQCVIRAVALGSPHTVPETWSAWRDEIGTYSRQDCSFLINQISRDFSDPHSLLESMRKCPY
jgi:hypothetical protein